MQHRPNKYHLFSLGDGFGDGNGTLALTSLSFHKFLQKTPYALRRTTILWAEATIGWTKCRSNGLVDLVFKFYKLIPDLFGNLLADVFYNWQKNGRILSDVGRDAIMRLENEGHRRHIQLWAYNSAKLKVWDFSKHTIDEFSIDGLVRWSIKVPNPEQIHSGYSEPYAIQQRNGWKRLWLWWDPDQCGLGESLGEDRPLLLEFVLKEARFGSTFKNWAAAMHSGNCLGVEFNGHLTEPFRTAHAVL